MNPILANFQEQLTQNKRTLEQLLASTQPTLDHQEIEKGDEFNFLALNSSNGITASIRLDQINIALKQFEIGKAGLCIDCDQPINPERLAAYPNASPVRCKPCHENWARKNSIQSSLTLFEKRRNYW